MMYKALLRYGYTLLLYLILPLFLLRLVWRSRKLSTYRLRLDERLGCITLPKDLSNVIWIHAVSVGEVIVATPIVKELLKSEKYHIVLTTTTPTGSELAKTRFNHYKRWHHCYIPYDIPAWVNKLLDHTQPRLAIFIETELWPNYLHYLGKRHIPVLIANARLSDKSANNYSRFSTITHMMLTNISKVAAQSREDRDRFINLGLAPHKAVVYGSIKFDLTVPDDLEEKLPRLKKLLGLNRLIWIASSTHEGEEQQILDAFDIVRKQVSNCLLLLVPRHPDRFARVHELCLSRNYKIIRRSQKRPCNDAEIFLGDTMGELLLFYAVSHVAFVGGSLISQGGHNILEPAMFSLPIITGPYTFNFAKVVQLLKDNHALLTSHNSKELSQQVIDLLSNKTKSNQYGRLAKKVFNQNGGAVGRHISLIKEMLQIHPSDLAN